MISSAQRKRFQSAPPLDVKPEEYHIRYYPAIDILQYPWVYVVRGPNHTPPNARTGTMAFNDFQRVKNDIRAHGVVNPFIIEYYCKEYPQLDENGPRRLRPEPCLAIRTGNNRAEAMHQLMMREARAVFAVPVEVIPQLPQDAVYRVLPIDRRLEHELDKLWTQVKRGNDEPIGPARAWRDSVLLQNLIRNVKS